MNKTMFFSAVIFNLWTHCLFGLIEISVLFTNIYIYGLNGNNGSVDFSSDFIYFHLVI